MYRKLAVFFLLFLFLFFSPYVAWAQTAGSSVRYKANNVADVVGDIEVSLGVLANTLTARPLATDGGELTLNEGVDDGTDTFKISIPSTGLSASVDHETDATGKLPTSAIQNLSGTNTGDTADLNDIMNVTLTTPGDGAVLCFTGTSNDSVDCTVGGDATATEDSGTLTLVVANDSHDHTTTTISGLVDDDISDILTASIIDLEAGTVTNIADTEIIVGDSAGSAAYVVLSNDATLANTGALTLAAKHTTGMKSFAIPDPTGSDDALVQFYFPTAATIIRVVCSTDTGTATLQLDERAEVTPNTGGVDVLTAPIVCDTNSEITTSFANATIAADVPLNVDVDATASTPGVVRVHIKYTID